MKFIVHYTIWDYADSIVIEWDTIEEIRGIVDSELEKRWATYMYSEQIED